jgi:hypothetical protein
MRRKGVGSPESVVTRELRAKRRAAQKKDEDASTIPKEVQVARLYHRGKVRTVFGNPRPAGLIYSDDDDNALDKVDDDEDNVEKNFSSFPSEVRSRNRVLGGPQRPDTSKMSEKEEVAALEKFKKMRRKYTDKRRNTIAKTMQEADLASSPQRTQMITYSGDQTPSIRLMMVVEAYPLLDGQLFQTKEILMIRIAEEANLRHIKVKVVKSNHVAYIVAGHNFYFAAGVRMESGWLVRVACCREGNDNLSIPPNVHYVNERKLRLPFRGKWVSYLLQKTVEDCPGTSYRVMSEVIRDYINPYAVTNNILQDARDHARAELFGKAEENVKYSYALRDELVAKGHVCKLQFTTRRKVLRQV